jgi:hypothetical protein
MSEIEDGFEHFFSLAALNLILPFTQTAGSGEKEARIVAEYL